MEKKKLIIILLIILIIILFTIKIISFHDNHKHYREYREIYLTNNFTEIEDWMTIKTIEREFDIDDKDIEKELGDKLSLKEKRKTLKEICEKEKFDCNNVTSNLNKKIKDD